MSFMADVLSQERVYWYKWTQWKDGVTWRMTILWGWVKPRLSSFICNVHVCLVISWILLFTGNNLCDHVTNRSVFSNLEWTFSKCNRVSCTEHKTNQSKVPRHACHIWRIWLLGYTAHDMRSNLLSTITIDIFILFIDMSTVSTVSS